MTHYLKSPIITVDLDSTLYDTTHRHHLIDRENGTDWHAYSAACVDDTVIEGTRQLVFMAASAGTHVHYVTGRTESAREVTMTKLKSDGLPISNECLWMDDTETADHIMEFGSHARYKVHRIFDVIRETKATHLFHIDDYAEVAIECTKAGLACICVRTPHEILELGSSELV